MIARDWNVRASGVCRGVGYVAAFADPADDEPADGIWDHVPAMTEDEIQQTQR